MNTFDIAAFKDIYTIGSGEKFIELNNTVGQRWFVPFHHNDLFLSLFQPSSVKGKLFAKSINWLKFCPMLLGFANARIVKLSFSKPFKAYANKVFDIEYCQFGIFCGSPGFHQKITIMAADKDKVMGYCKITDKMDIFNLFDNEFKHLQYLQSQGVCHVPAPLFCGKLPFANLYAFFQTTERNGKVKFATYLSPEVLDFIKDFNNRTKLDIPFDNSDFTHSLIRLKQNLKFLNDKGLTKTFMDGVNLIEDNKECFKEFCASHGDLTAWNSFIVDGNLFAFDLEYFKKSNPLLWDFFHFFTQDLLYNGYADSDKIYCEYLNVKKILPEIRHLDYLYIAYLLVIVDFYLNRDKGILNGRLGSCFIIWSELVQKLMNDVKEIN